MTAPRAAAEVGGGEEKTPPDEYWASGAYLTKCEAFLARCNPTLGRDALASQAFDLQRAAVARARQGADVEDVCDYSLEDPRNVWALTGRFSAGHRLVELPLLQLKLSVAQLWGAGGGGTEDPDYEAGACVDGHTTGYTVWDGGVVLADLLTHPPEVLLSLSPVMARRQAPRWSWEGKSVVELGCGVGALPSFAAALQGASPVFCTDGDGAVIPELVRNVERLAETHPQAAGRMRPTMLRWGEGGEADALGSTSIPVDVIVAADVLYVLGNPGAWGALLRTIVALSHPETMVFLTYTDRGNGKTMQRYLERVGREFHVTRVPQHLLHPIAQPGCVARLEQHVGECQVFCLAKRV